MSFKTKGAKSFRTLDLGTKTPTGSDMYARVDGEKKVFLVQSYLDSTFNRKPFDLRDKKVLNFDREKVDRVEIADGDKLVALAKTGADWRVAAPVEARGDFGAIEQLISRVQSASDEIGRQRSGHRSQGVRARQAGDDRHRRPGQRAGRSRDWQEGGRRRSSTRETCRKTRS